VFSKSVLDKNKVLEERWAENCIELYGDKEFKTVTDSGIELKPVYTAADIEGIEYEDIGLPGEHPFTRGCRPLQYQAEGWLVSQLLGYGMGKDGRDRRKLLESAGMPRTTTEKWPTRQVLVVDLPTQRGYDPDEPAAWGRIGRDGVSIPTIREMEALFDGIPLEDAETMFVCMNASLPLLAMYIVYAERRGVPQHKLRMRGHNQLYRWWCDDICFLPRGAMKLIVEQIKHSVEFMPLMRHTSIMGYGFSEGGATLVQEIAFMLATAIAFTDECIKVGLDPDDVVPGFYWHCCVGLNLFEEIAKYRALRRMAAKIFKERFGCKKPESLRIALTVQSGGSHLPAQEPLNNIMRNFIMVLAGVLGGVDAISTAGYDEAWCLPSDEAALIALRTQQIIYHETNIPAVADPLGGSYYIEWLTNKTEEEAYKLIQKVDEIGYLKYWEEGWFRRELAKSANERQRKIEKGEKIIVGVNKYRLPREEEPELRMFKIDPKVDEEAIARVKKFRAERDSEKAARALAEMRVAAQRLNDGWPSSCGCLMPAMIDAFRADATLGEVNQVLREVFGYGYVY
jgi:methylmalonyl-CoA mutase N-terminal domain/subunit